MPLSRAEALDLVKSWTKNEGLIKHMLGVEAEMRALAKHFSADEDLWGITGLVHDADYEMHPDEHPGVLLNKLKEQSAQPEIIQAVTAHAYQYNNFSVEPSSQLDWALFCADELAGLITATTLVRPDRQLAATTVDSVLKKFPNKGFARGVHREHIAQCEATLGLPLPQFIEICLSGMRSISADLGL